MDDRQQCPAARRQQSHRGPVPSPPGITGCSLVLTATLLVLALIAAWTPRVSARPLDEVKASKLLRVVAYDDNRPFSWIESGAARGIDVDIAHALARRLGVELQIILRKRAEKIDDDLRANVWRGPATGGSVGDVMLHVPVGGELAIRGKETMIGHPYFEKRLAIAIDPARTGESPALDVFRRERIAVQLGTVADYFLMFYDGGILRPSITHFVKAEDGVELFLRKEVSALMGVRSEIEALFGLARASVPFVEPAMPGLVRSRWPVGIAVKSNGRDLYNAVGAFLSEIQASGELASICARYGVSYAPAAVK